MASLTLNVDETLLRQARVRALRQGTSVNTLVREWLERYAGEDEQRTASDEIVELLEQTDANSGPAPWKWNREEIYEERVARYGRR